VDKKIGAESPVFCPGIAEQSRGKKGAPKKKLHPFLNKSIDLKFKIRQNFPELFSRRNPVRF
jgi:hypothetical protein